MNKPSFEQLIEYVINDEESKARELFHQIVVEKSRAIYESLMDEEEQEVAESDEVNEEEEVNEELGGDQADSLIDEVEIEEEGLSMEGEEELEDRVVDLEDKLDELMAEFEAMMSGDEAGEEEMTDMEVDDDEMETEGMMRMPMEEAVSLKAAPKPVTAEEAGVNTSSTVAANSGATGSAAKPVKSETATENGRPAPTAKDMGGTTSPKQGPATKPHLAQATGVNTNSPIA